MALASQLDATNHRGETFLHVLDPTFLVPSELSRLTRYLAGRGFNFTQLDEAGQSFIDRLMSNPSFPIESLEAIFLHLSESDRLALIHRQPGLRQLTDTIRSRLLSQGAADPPQAATISAYCEYFADRYGTAHRPVWITPTLLCNVPVTKPTGRNRLHQLVAALNVGRTMMPPTTHDLCLNRPGPNSGPDPVAFVWALSLALDTLDDINNREEGTLRTPLITLLRGLSWGQHPEPVAAQLVGMMLARGAEPGLSDAEGNNALHWAARLGLLRAVVLICAHDSGLKTALNGAGKTALDLAVEGMVTGVHLLATEGVRAAARHRDVVLFLETGLVAEP